MFKTTFFKSDSWHKVIEKFAEVKGVPPIVEIKCLDGESLKVFKMRPWKSCLVLEIYLEPGKTSMRFLPYEQIKYIEFKEEESEEQFDQQEPIGFKTPKEEE